MNNFTTYILIILIHVLTASNSYGRLSNKVIYGENDMVFTHRVDNVKARAVAKSVAMMVNKSSLNTIVSLSLFSLKTQTLGESAPMCEGNPLKDKIALGLCSGVLIGKNTILTAGHCVNPGKFDCAGKSFLFDVRNDFFTNTQSQYFSRSQVYHCQSVSRRQVNLESGLDYAIIELDRDVTNRPEVAFSSNSEVFAGDEIYMIGHPLGLGSMTSTNGKIRFVDDSFYRAEIDSFVGHSGSPVFSKQTDELVGILSQGEEDFIWNKDLKCFDLRNCPEGECRGEDIVKIGAIIEDADL